MPRSGTMGLLATAALALAAAGCGTSSSGTGSFANQANNVCQSINVEISAVTPPGDPTTATASQLPAWAQYFQKTIPLAQKGNSELQALTPPASEQGNFSKLVESNLAQTVDAQAAERAASSGNLSAFVQATQKMGTDGSAGDPAATAAGLTQCSSSGGGNSGGTSG